MLDVSHLSKRYPAPGGDLSDARAVVEAGCRFALADAAAARALAALVRVGADP